MNGNPDFPSPDIKLSVLKEATDKLELCLLASHDGERKETAKLHQQVKIWNNLMRKQALYVERIADDNIVIAMGSGFSLAKPPIPGKRADFIVKHGDKPLSVYLRRKAVKNASAYIWQYCINSLAENEKDWVYCNVSKQASCQINDLIGLTKYWFRVAVVTTKGISDYCSPIMIIVG